MPTQIDYFLKIQGIEGESQDSKHSGEIQLEGFDFNVVNRGRHGDYKVGKPVHDDAKFSALIDQAYPKINLACANGEHISKAVLTCRKAGTNQQDYFKITLSDVLITSCQIKGKDDNYPLVEFTVGFASQQVDYREQKEDGSLGGTLSAIVNLSGKNEPT